VVVASCDGGASKVRAKAPGKFGFGTDPGSYDETLPRGRLARGRDGVSAVVE
jgi:hypothetical protein